MLIHIICILGITGYPVCHLEMVDDCTNKTQGICIEVPVDE
jgi:hypothetical protein